MLTTLVRARLVSARRANADADADNFGGRAVLLVAHGSRNPGAELVVDELADAVRRELPGRAVAVAYLDFTAPSVGEALRVLVAGGVREVVAVPLLFAPGYHLRVDLPAAIAEVRAGHPGLTVVVAPVLGQAPGAGEPDRLLDALESRLEGPAPPGAPGAPASRRADGCDAVVLASAGSSDPAARTAVEDLADRWAQRSGRPVLSAYATGCGPTVAEAIAELRSRGLQRVAVASLFLAPGRLPEVVRAAAVESGAVAVSGPIGADPGLVELVVRRQEEGSSVSGPGRSFPSFV